MVASFVLAMFLSNVPATPQSGAAQQPPAPPAQTQPEQPWPPAGVYRTDQGVTVPRLLKEVKPRYPPDAMHAKIDGTVFLEAVVKPDGTVGEVRIKRSLDKVFGLDDEAVSTLKKWLFTAGRKDGVAVPVLVEVEMTFRVAK